MSNEKAWFEQNEASNRRVRPDIKKYIGNKNNIGWEFVITVLIQTPASVALMQKHIFPPMAGQDEIISRDGTRFKREYDQIAVCLGSPRGQGGEPKLDPAGCEACSKIMLPDGRNIHELGPNLDSKTNSEEWFHGVLMWSHTEGKFLGASLARYWDGSLLRALWREIMFKYENESPMTYAIRLGPREVKGERRGYNSKRVPLPGVIPNMQDPNVQAALGDNYREAYNIAYPYETAESIVQRLGLTRYNSWAVQGGVGIAAPVSVQVEVSTTPAPLVVSPGAVGVTADPWAVGGPNPFDTAPVVPNPSPTTPAPFDFNAPGAAGFAARLPVTDM
jgi:hypothetical protein